MDDQQVRSQAALAQFRRFLGLAHQTSIPANQAPVASDQALVPASQVLFTDDQSLIPSDEALVSGEQNFSADGQSPEPFLLGQTFDTTLPALSLFDPSDSPTEEVLDPLSPRSCTLPTQSLSPPPPPESPPFPFDPITADQIPVIIRPMYIHLQNRLIKMPDIHTTLSRISDPAAVLNVLNDQPTFFVDLYQTYDLFAPDINAAILCFRHAGGLSRIRLDRATPLDNLTHHPTLASFIGDVSNGRIPLPWTLTRNCNCFSPTFANFAHCNGSHFHVLELHLVFKSADIIRRTQLLLTKYLAEFAEFEAWRTPEFIGEQNALWGTEVVSRQMDHVLYLLRVQDEVLMECCAELEAAEAAT